MIIYIGALRGGRRLKADTVTTKWNLVEKNNVLENSESSGAVPCMLTHENEDGRHGTSGFCLNHVLDLGGYLPSG